MAEVGVLCGLEAEAQALGRWRHDPRVAVRVSGVRPEVAEAQARLLAAEGAQLILSWGIAGGLARALSPGDLLIGSEVIPDRGPRLPLHVPSDRWGRPLYGATRLAASPGEKARIRAETGADAIDMESLSVARIAAEAGVRAVAVRAVADPATRGVPAFLEKVIGPDGRPRPARLLAGMAREPAAFAALVGLRREFRAALLALRQFAERELGSILDEAHSG